MPRTPRSQPRDAEEHRRRRQRQIADTARSAARPRFDPNRARRMVPIPPCARSLTSDSFETTVTRTMPGTVRTPRVYEQIVGHIERAIYDGRLRQGQKLPPERQLARDLKASRVAVREALRTLELRGLVDVRQGSTGGYFVREADDRPLVRDFETLIRLGRVSWPQLIEARRFIEPEVASLAAQRATEADLKTLGAALEQRWEHAAVSGVPARQSYVDFHRALAEA